MKRFLLILISTVLLLSGCALSQSTSEKKQYTETFLTLFDTVTSIVGRADSEEEFKEIAGNIYDELKEYHELFDIYNEYEDVKNIKTINDNAGIAPVEVDERIIALLLDCKSFYEQTDGKVNVAMGSVLSQWHECRSFGRDNPSQATLPVWDELQEAAKHTDFSSVLIDETASTVYITDPLVQLDVGAIAKGWSVQRVAEKAPKGLLISVGGNVCATGPKDEKGTQWVVGVQNPDDQGKYLHTLLVTEGSVVSSGDYQRRYEVNGKMYHHIIDPDTLYPSEYWRMVTIVCPDSGVADALSTSLFLMSQEEGEALLEQYGAEAMWVDDEGKIYYSFGFKKMIRT